MQKKQNTQNANNTFTNMKYKNVKNANRILKTLLKNKKVLQQY